MLRSTWCIINIQLIVVIIAIIIFGLSLFSVLHQALSTLKRALQPAVEDVSVNWDLPRGLSAKILSPEQTVLYKGQRLIVYAQLTGTMPVSSYSCLFPLVRIATAPTSALDTFLKTGGVLSNDHTCQVEPTYPLLHDFRFLIS